MPLRQKNNCLSQYDQTCLATLLRIWTQDEAQTNPEQLTRPEQLIQPEQLTRAIDREAHQRLSRLMAGITAYRHHPYRRFLSDPPILWQSGTTRILGYETSKKTTGKILLIVPSLINRSYILDLMPQQSLLRFLAQQGFIPLLVDWDKPGLEEQNYHLNDYVQERLIPALDYIRDWSGGQKPVLVGYCMGGLLAVALACQRQNDLSGLALLATPWDFHAQHPRRAKYLAQLIHQLNLPQLGGLPADLLQALFGISEPFAVVSKFTAFANVDPNSDKARQFVALEDWLNDGVPLTTNVARDCLIGWYGENRPARLRWHILDQQVDPRKLRLPALLIMPQRDRIVAPVMAQALAAHLPQASLLAPRLGHIGMIVGRSARIQVWRPLVDWLKNL